MLEKMDFNGYRRCPGNCLYTLLGCRTILELLDFKTKLSACTVCTGIGQMRVS